MKIGNLFKIALKALNNNKMRCFLTMLGIIIGVASVITMLAIGQGSKDSIKKQISEMGSNMIMIFPGNMERGGVQQSSDDMQSMKPVDFENIRDEAKFVAAVSPMVSSQGQFICGANNYPSKVEGVNADYLEIRKLKVKDGMAFSDLDIKRASKVCVVGKTVVDKLFPNGGNPMGRVIRFNSIPLTIIGVLESKGYNSMGQDQDDIVLAPYTTVMKRILAIDYIQGIFASALTEAATDQATDEIEKILNRNHKIKSEDEEDYDIRSQQELSEMLNSTGDMMTLLLACVAGISLLVGGIGIMNIMLVSVTERTREIGIRLAIGALAHEVLLQFLIEAVALSALGGLIGIVLALFVCLGLTALMHMPFLFNPGINLLAFVFSAAIGIVFGYMPARRAARLDPIVALRFE